MFFRENHLLLRGRETIAEPLVVILNFVERGSGLNHTVHGPKVKTEYTKRQFNKNNEGKIISEKLVYFKDNKKESLLFKQAMSEPLKVGVLSIYAHGNSYNINYYVTIAGIENMLIKDSSMWQDFKSNHGKLTIDLKSCNTGLMSSSLNISESLTFLNKGLIIYAPAAYWNYDGTIQNNAGYNKFFNGKVIDYNLKR